VRESQQGHSPALDLCAEPTLFLRRWVYRHRTSSVTIALPNESRLSCGAKLECSQTEFYNTGRRHGMRG